MKSRTHYALRALRLALEEMGVGRMTCGYAQLRRRVRARRPRPGRAAGVRGAPERLPGLHPRGPGARRPAGAAGPGGPGGRREPDTGRAGCPSSVLAGLVEVRRTEARRRRRLGAVGALAAAAVAAGVLMVSTLGGNEPGATATAHRPPAVSTVTPSTQPGVVAGRAMTQVGQHQLRAWVGVEDVAWGTRLRLTCRYQNAGGYPRAGPGVLAGRAHQGRPHPACRHLAGRARPDDNAGRGHRLPAGPDQLSRGPHAGGTPGPPAAHLIGTRRTGRPHRRVRRRARRPRR